MKIDEFSIKVNDLISKNKFKDAIKLMRELLQESPQLNEVLAQSGRFQELERQERLGIVDYQNANIEKNKIRYALLGLIEDIRENIEGDNTIKREFESIQPEKIYLVLEQPKYAKWVYFLVLPFILGVFSFLAWNAYQAFYPKSDGEIDNNRCWVTTNWTFTKLMNEPSFQPKGIITELPGTKTYHVLEIANVEMGQKCYKIEDKKLGVTGWVQEHDLAKIHDVCFKNPPKSVEPKSNIDKTKCWLKTDEFITELYFKPEHMPQKIGELHGSKEYQVLDVKEVYSTFFFKIKDEATQTVGWVRNFNLTSVSPICFNNNSHGSTTKPIHEKSNLHSMQDEFKKAESDFNKQHEALKRENEKGFNEVMKEGEKIQKEVMSKFNKQ